MSHKLIILSGCSGGGKSTLLDALGKSGHAVMPEAGREIVKEQLETQGGITPWQNPQAFCELIIARSVEKFRQAAERPGHDGAIFFDRSFLDGVAGYQSLKIADSGKYDHLIDELRYHPTVCMTPPWQEIYRQDGERKHSFEDAVTEY